MEGHQNENSVAFVKHLEWGQWYISSLLVFRYPDNVETWYSNVQIYSKILISLTCWLPQFNIFPCLYNLFVFYFFSVWKFYLDRSLILSLIIIDLVLCFDVLLLFWSYVLMFLYCFDPVIYVLILFWPWVLYSDIVLVLCSMFCCYFGPGFYLLILFWSCVLCSDVVLVLCSMFRYCFGPVFWSSDVPILSFPAGVQNLLPASPIWCTQAIPHLTIPLQQWYNWFEKCYKTLDVFRK